MEEGKQKKEFATLISALNGFRYYGEIVFEDEQIIRLNDEKEGITDLPRNFFVVKRGFRK